MRPDLDAVCRGVMWGLFFGLILWLAVAVAAAAVWAVLP